MNKELKQRKKWNKQNNKQTKNNKNVFFHDIVHFEHYFLFFLLFLSFNFNVNNFVFYLQQYQIREMMSTGQTKTEDGKKIKLKTPVKVRIVSYLVEKLKCLCHIVYQRGRYIHFLMWLLLSFFYFEVYFIEYENVS